VPADVEQSLERAYLELTGAGAGAVDPDRPAVGVATTEGSR
jgi:hypothetical protein